MKETRLTDIIGAGNKDKSGETWDEIRSSVQAELAKKIGLEGKSKEVARMPKEKMVTIPLSTYKELLEDSEFLECLKACGVDNWGGWDEACQMLREDE